MNKPFESILLFADLEKERKQAENDAVTDENSKGEKVYKIRNRG